MKKLAVAALVAALFVSCSKTNIEDDNESHVQLVDKSENVRPGNQGSTN